MRGRKYLEEAGHLRVEFGFAGAVAARRHRPEGAAVIAVVAADELDLARTAGLFVELADEFQCRLYGLRSAAQRFYEIQIARRDLAHALDEIERDVRDGVQRRNERRTLHLDAHRLHNAG